NEGRLIFAKGEYLVVTGNSGDARNHDPVLRPLVVHLQGEFGAGIDGDTLDLKFVAAVDAFISAPGAVHLAVGDMELTAFTLKLLNDLLDPLGGVLAAHQHGI